MHSSLELKTAIMESADPLAAFNGICVTGGRLNVAAALASLGSKYQARTKNDSSRNASLPSNLARGTAVFSFERGGEILTT